MRIGIYVGDANDPLSNVTASLSLWTQYLSEFGHDVDLFGGSLPSNNTQASYNQFRISYKKKVSKIGKIPHSYNICFKYCNKRDPDVLAQFWKYPVHAPAVVGAGTRIGIPTVLRFNGDVFNQHRGFNGITRYIIQGFNLPSRVAPRFADAVVAFGPYGEDELVRQGVSRNNIYTLPPSGDMGERFVPPNDKDRLKEEFNFPKDKTVALYVGRIEGVKGMDYISDVISQIEPNNDIKFVFVGGGSGESEHPNGEFAETFNDAGVRIEGKVPHDKIHKYYQAADVYVHPSPYEGIPLTILEALQCELPVIARPAGDIPFVVPNIVTEPADMAHMLLQETWELGWKNRRLFTEEYQQTTLNQIIADAATVSP